MSCSSPFAALVARFLAWATPRRRPATLKLYRLYLGRFAAQVGDVAVAAITIIDVETFAVAKNPLEIVRRLFRWAVATKLLAVSPCEGMAIPKSGRRDRILSRRERVIFRRLACPELRALLLFLEETAARPIESRSIEWEDLRGTLPPALRGLESQDDPLFFELSAYKARLRRKNPHFKRVLPISARLARLLRRLRDRPGTPPTGPVFKSQRMDRWTANALRCAFRRLRERARGEAGVKVTGVVPYSYRHTLATQLALAGVNARLLADFLGHAGLELLSWYVHPSTVDLCRVVCPRRKDRRE